MENKGSNKYIKLCDEMLRALKRAHIPLHFSKFSNKIFTVHQLCVLLGLKQYEKNKGYERFAEWLECSDSIYKHLGLKRIPHFTTPQKFAQRIAVSLLSKIINSFIAAIPFIKHSDSDMWPKSIFWDLVQ